jgi:osmotically-inducible protein OsmY
MSTTKSHETGARLDGDVARDAYHHMKADLQVPDDRVRVRVSGGVATLSGTVQHDEQKRATESCVRAVNGVRDVINQILVEPATSGTEG